MFHSRLLIENSSLVAFISFEQFYLYYSLKLENSCFNILISFLSSFRFSNLLQGTIIAEFDDVAILGVDNFDLEHAPGILNGSSLVLLIELFDTFVQVCRSIHK